MVSKKLSIENDKIKIKFLTEENDKIKLVPFRWFQKSYR